MTNDDQTNGQNDGSINRAGLGGDQGKRGAGSRGRSSHVLQDVGIPHPMLEEHSEWLKRDWRRAHLEALRAVRERRSFARPRKQRRPARPKPKSDPAPKVVLLLIPGPTAEDLRTAFSHWRSRLDDMTASATMIWAPGSPSHAGASMVDWIGLDVLNDDSLEWNELKGELDGDAAEAVRIAEEEWVSLFGLDWLDLPALIAVPRRDRRREKDNRLDYPEPIALRLGKELGHAALEPANFLATLETVFRPEVVEAAMRSCEPGSAAWTKGAQALMSEFQELLVIHGRGEVPRVSRGHSQEALKVLCSVHPRRLTGPQIQARIGAGRGSLGHALQAMVKDGLLDLVKGQGFGATPRGLVTRRVRCRD